MSKWILTGLAVFIAVITLAVIVGRARDGAVQDQIDASVEGAVKH